MNRSALELLMMHDDYTRRYEACCDRMVEQMLLIPDPEESRNKPEPEDFEAFERPRTNRSGSNSNGTICRPRSADVWRSC